MGEVNIRALPQFELDAQLTGFSKTKLTEIKNTVHAHPTHGHRIFDLSQSGLTIPLVGFYTRPWSERLNQTSHLEACTLHLYLGPGMDIYLFNMSSCYQHEVPWRNMAEALTITATSMLKVLG